MYKCVHVQVTHACDLSVAFVFDLCVCVCVCVQMSNPTGACPLNPMSPCLTLKDPKGVGM